MAAQEGAWHCLQHGAWDLAEVEGVGEAMPEAEGTPVTPWTLGVLDALPVHRFAPVSPLCGHIERPEIEEGHALLLFPLSSPPSDAESSMKASELRSVQRLLDAHGRETLCRIVDGLERGVSFADLAREVGMSREYIRQIAAKLGVQTTIYVVHPEVLREAEEPGVPLVFRSGGVSPEGRAQSAGFNPEED